MSKALEIRKQIRRNRIMVFVNRNRGYFMREENLIKFKDDPECILKDYEIVRRSGPLGLGPQGTPYDIIIARLIFDDYVHVHDVSGAIYG